MYLEELHSDRKYPKKTRELPCRHPTKGACGTYQTWAVPTTSAMVAPKKRKPKTPNEESGG